jgi:hypothetical protein
MAALAGTASLTLVNGRVRVAHAGWVSRFARRHRSGQFFVLVLRFSFFVFRSERRAAFGRNGRSCGNGLALVNGGLTSFARKDLSLCSGEWQLRRIAASVTLRSSFFVLRSSF